MTIFRAAAILMLISTSTLVAFCQKTPKAIVNLYCSLDGEGARYSSQQRQSREIDRIEVNPVEAAWDESTIVSDFKIVEVKQRNGGAEVTVLYHILGHISSELEVVSSSSEEKVTFSVTRVEGKWKVDHAEIGPHITEKGILTILNGERAEATKKAQTSTDPQVKEVRAKLNATILKIESW